MRLNLPLRPAAALILSAAWLAQCSGADPVSPTPTATQLFFVRAPDGTPHDHTVLTPSPVVQLADADGNPVALAGRSVTLTSSAPGLVVEGSGVPVSATTDTRGRATFNDVRVRGTVGNYQLRFQSAGLTTLSAPVALGHGAAAQIAWVGGPDSSTVGVAVAGLSVALLDSSANRIASTAFALSVTAGQGTVGGATSAGSDGLADVATFTLDTLTGLNTVRASVAAHPEIAPASRSVVGVAGAPTLLAKVSGDSQITDAGTPVPAPLVVRATDRYGNPVGGATVRGTVTGGGGRLGAGPILDHSTAPGGLVQFTEWTMGNPVGPNAMTLTLPSFPTVPPVEFDATGLLGPPAIVTLNSDWPFSESIDTLFATPLVATVTDLAGNPIAGRRVIFHSNDSVVADADTVTDSLGQAAIHQVRAPTTPGGWSIILTIPGSQVMGAKGFNLQAGPPVRIEVVGDSSVRSPVGRDLVFQARVFDGFGNEAGNKLVAWHVVSGPGTLHDIHVITEANGVSFTNVTLGAQAGRTTIEAYPTLLPDSVLHFTVDALAPVAIHAIAGDSQRVVAGDTLGAPLTVRVVDSAGAGVQGIPIHFSDRPIGDSVLTDSAGSATAPPIVARAQVDPYAIHASSGWVVDSSASWTVLPHSGPATELVQTCCGGNLIGIVDKVLAPAPGVKLRDRLGLPVVTGTIHFAVSSGSLAADSAMVDSVTAAAVSPDWRLGKVAGDQKLTATFGALPPLELFATAKPGTVDTLTAIPGHAITGFVNEQVAYGVVVEARDRFGNLAAGKQWTTAGAGGGVTGGHSGQFGQDGRAYIDGWTLGSVGTANLVRVSAGSATLDLSAEGVTQSPFNMVLRGVPDAFLPVFRQATFNWRRRITADIPDITVSIPAAACAPFQAGVSGTVDDVVIDVDIGPIDGAGGILGGATPCFIRTASRLPLLGVMQFDDADLEQLRVQGTLGDVILHEMGHVLGIGSLWANDALVAGAGSADPQYTGAGGEQGWSEIGGVPLGSVTVPVENTGGAGTRDVHWRESVMPSELMTGFLSALVNPMSAVTVRSLADLGYTVDPSTADAYTVMTAPMPARGVAPLRIQDRVGAPRFTVDASGRITPLP